MGSAQREQLFRTFSFGVLHQSERLGVVTDMGGGPGDGGHQQPGDHEILAEDETVVPDLCQLLEEPGPAHPVGVAEVGKHTGVDDAERAVGGHFLRLGAENLKRVSLYHGWWMTARHLDSTLKKLDPAQMRGPDAGSQPEDGVIVVDVDRVYVNSEPFLGSASRDAGGAARNSGCS